MAFPSNGNHESIKRTIEHRFDPSYSALMFKIVQRLNVMHWLFDDIHVEGLERVPRDKQVVYVGNHLSHSDYMVAWYTLLNAGIELPRFCAGINLDHPYILGMLGMDFRRHGAFFVDRDLMRRAHLDKRKEYASVLDQVTHEMLDRGEHIFIFPEGGRQYSGVPATTDKVKKTIFRVLTDPARDVRDIAVVPVAFAYNKRIEESAFDSLLKVNGRATLLDRAYYYGTDLGSFFTRISDRSVFDEREHKCSISFGEPLDLRETVQGCDPSTSWVTLRSSAWDRVRALQESISYLPATNHH